MIGSRRVTLIHQNDTHAHFKPHSELRWNEGLLLTWRTGGYNPSRTPVSRRSLVAV